MNDKYEEKLAKFINKTYEVVKENDKIYEFECPLCGNKVFGEKASNGHLHAGCKNCKIGFRM